MSGKHVNLQQPAVCDAEEKMEMLGFQPSLSHQGSCETSELLNGGGGGENAGGGVALRACYAQATGIFGMLRILECFTKDCV